MLNANHLFDQVLQVLVIMVRMGSIFILFPIFGQSTISTTIKLAATLTISVCLFPAVHNQLPQWTFAKLPGNYEILMVVLREFLIGAGMGFVARCFFSSCISAAEWVGTQMGFSMGAIFSTESQEDVSAWAEFNQWVATILFLSIGGHLFMLQALVDSYKFNFADFGAKILDPKLSALFWGEIGAQFFLWMLKLSAPMVAVLLMLQMSLGILSKFVPQINIWIVSIPITMGVGVLVFSVMSPMYGDALKHLFSDQIHNQYLWLKFVGVR